MIVKTADGTYYIGPRPEKVKLFTKRNNSKGNTTRKVKAANRAAVNTPLSAAEQTGIQIAKEINRSNSNTQFVLLDEQRYKNLLALLKATRIDLKRKGSISIESKKTQAQEISLDNLDLNTRLEISRILKLCIYGIICCNIYAFFLIYYGADKLSELE